MHDHPHRHPPHIDAPHEAAFDAGTESLARALRLSFSLLKLVMLVLIVAYLFSGVYTVQPDEVAVRLHLGRYVGTYGEGGHVAWPFPVDTIVKMPARKVRTVEVPTFWPAMAEGAAEKALREEREELRNVPTGEGPRGAGGYCLTGDVNLLHYYWLVTYRIADPVAYMTNVTGFNVADRAPEERLVRTVVENAVIRNVNHYEVLPAMREKLPELARRAKAAAQKALDALDSGIEIVELIASTPPIPPRQVDLAFKDVFAAREERYRQIEEAEGYVNEQLGAVAGNDGRPLYEAISALEAAADHRTVQAQLAALEREIADVRPAVEAGQRSRNDLDRLEAQQAALRLRLEDLAQRKPRTEEEHAALAARVEELYRTAGGQVSRMRSDAESQRERAVKDAQADAASIRTLLEEYENDRARLEPYLEHLRIETLQAALAAAEDKYILNPRRGDTNPELWMKISAPIERLKEKYRLEETR